MLGCLVVKVEALAAAEVELLEKMLARRLGTCGMRSRAGQLLLARKSLRRRLRRGRRLKARSKMTSVWE